MPSTPSDNFGCIGVIMGGTSSEREISLKSGKAVSEALISRGCDVKAVDLTTEDKNEIARILKDAGIEVAFIALHGRFGEDGSLQQILQDLDIPYTGSGVVASRLALDKVASRRIFERNNVPTPRYWVFEKKEVDLVLNRIKDYSLPAVIKPATHGSSIGLSIVDNPETLQEAFGLAFEYDTRVILEEYIKGREVTVGILEEKALPVIEILPKHRFFDYKAKYEPGTEYVVPANLAPDLFLHTQNVALRAHSLLGCRGFSRVDIILSQQNIPVVLEINTIPGMTFSSLLPKAAKAVGMSFEQLVTKLIETALQTQRL